MALFFLLFFLLLDSFFLASLLLDNVLAQSESLAALIASLSGIFVSRDLASCSLLHSGSVAANKSLIMHMLSQVRVGMDLTRVTLPTFILEKRSLLQMYAEFFAHPDVFVQ